MDTLLGYQEITITLLGGGSETVRVRQLPIREYPAYLLALEDECRQVELLCAKPAGWADSITPESHEALISAGDKLNADFFARWLQRRLERQDRVAPGLVDRIVRSAVKEPAAPLPRPLPSSPSVPG